MKWMSKDDGMPPTKRMVATFKLGSVNAQGTRVRPQMMLGNVDRTSSYSLSYGEYFSFDNYDFWCLLPEIGD